MYSYGYAPLRRGETGAALKESRRNEKKERAIPPRERTMADRDALPLPLEVRARLAELELELSEGTLDVITDLFSRKYVCCGGIRSLPSSSLHPKTHHTDTTNTRCLEAIITAAVCVRKRVRNASRGALIPAAFPLLSICVHSD